MEWEKAVVDLVVAYWTEHTKPYALSRLKLDLRKMQIDLDSKLNGRKPREVLENDFRDCLTVFKNPEHELVWYMVPSTADLDVAVAALRSPQPKKLVGNSVEYDKAVFTAFIKQLDGEQRRFLFFGPKNFFDDKRAKDAAPDGGIEVLRSDISTPSGEQLTDEEKEDVSKRINEWLNRNGVQLELVIAPHRLERRDHRKAILSDVLDFSGLSASEKARILIPLDVLLKIRFG